MLFLRIPLGELQGFSPLWSYLSPLLHAPLIACAIGCCVTVLLTLSRGSNGSSPLLALALWNALCSLLLNGLLGGPQIYPVIDLMLRYGAGSYLGVITLLLPVMLWANWNAGPVRSSFPRDVAIAVVVILGLFFILGVLNDPSIRNVLMVAMLVPMAILTFRHGWKGTALGALLASFSIEFSMPKVYQVGFLIKMF